ncbi:MAG: hypothetical protein K2H31_06900 [Lachnospiraceae bacterium]|nr:hypothetical protein [Lachnospiraceae bacterium]
MMEKRRVGNYLKEYPHVYEVFQKEIKRQYTAIKVLIILLVVWFSFDLTCRLFGDADVSDVLNIFDPLIVVILIGPFFVFFMLFLKTRKISLEKLEMMENDLTEGKDMIRDCGYSTEKSFSIGFHRIPRKGLNTVYLGRVSNGGRYGGYGHELVFYYEDGTFIKAIPYAGELNNEQDIKQVVCRYDDGVKFYRHQIRYTSGTLLGRKIDAEVPSVRKETLEELSTLSNGNPFWRLSAKSRDKWNGCKEVEIALRGTALTYLLYLVWICLSVCFVLFFADLLESLVSHIILLAGLCCLVPGLCYYMFFYKSARKITDKAMYIFYRDFPSHWLKTAAKAESLQQFEESMEN